MLGIVTASTNVKRAQDCIWSWTRHATDKALPVYIVVNGGDKPYRGTVPAFREAVDTMLADHPEVDVVACFHDDLEITEPDWDVKVLRHFERQDACGLAGFGGAIGLGAADLYQTEYNPMQLARIGFRSNMPDASQHGSRSLLTERVACLDGFSQIGRRTFWEGQPGPQTYTGPFARPWTYLEELGVVHHFYDGMLGCLARRAGWETWYLPIGCVHYGGRTAVGDAGYQRWAATQTDGGDHGFWERAHRLGYEEFRDVLPLRV